MKTGRYSDAQIMGILKQAESGVPVSELCRDCGEGLACQHRVGVPHVSNRRDVLSLWTKI